MMKTFNAFNDGNKPLWEEGRALLVALGKRPELPAAVVYDLAFFYRFYIEDNDAEVLALARRWAKHVPAATCSLETRSDKIQSNQ